MMGLASQKIISVQARVPASNGGAKMVEAHDLQKSYSMGRLRVPVLQGVHFAAHAGEFIAVMGPSGCGKTTLLNCLAGLDAPDAGTVHVDGRDLHGLSDRRRTRHRAERMGFVFQSFNLLPVLTALENVEMPLLLLGRPRAEARARALGALKAVGLGDRLRHRPSELSGGEQQRVAIARALVNRPAIVWADEPTGNLDSGSGQEILELMRRLNQEQKVTLVVVTHDPNVARAAHRIVRMDSGRIVDDGRGGGARIEGRTKP